MSKNLGMLLAEDYFYLAGIASLIGYYGSRYFRNRRKVRNRVLEYAESLRESGTTRESWGEIKDVLILGRREKFAERVEKVLVSKGYLKD